MLRAAERLDDVALYLVVQAVGADDKAAAKLGAVQFHRIAQDVEQHGVGLNVDILRAAVNFQLQFTCHFSSTFTNSWQSRLDNN